MTRCTCAQAVREATAERDVRIDALRISLEHANEEIDRLRSRLEQAHMREMELEEAFATFDNDDCTPEDAERARTVFGGYSASAVRDVEIGRLRAAIIARDAETIQRDGENALLTAEIDRLRAAIVARDEIVDDVHIRLDYERRAARRLRRRLRRVLAENERLAAIAYATSGALTAVEPPTARSVWGTSEFRPEELRA